MEEGDRIKTYRLDRDNVQKRIIYKKIHRIYIDLSIAEIV